MLVGFSIANVVTIDLANVSFLPSTQEYTDHYRRPVGHADPVSRLQRDPSHVPNHTSLGHKLSFTQS